MTRRARRAAVLTFAAALLAGLGASQATGQPGDLRFVQCIEDASSGGEGCPRRAAGLDNPSGLVISRDGRFAYVTSFESGAVLQLRRNKRTGKLRAGECLDDPRRGACPRSVGGLRGAIDLELGRDGRHLYVLANRDSTLLHFRRNKRTGKLRLATCIDDAGLAPVDDVCPGGAKGLGGPRDLALSPDGRSLYVASQADSALVRFSVNRRTGKPRIRDCWEDDDNLTLGDCARVGKGLRDASGVAVSPNGRFVYVAASGDSAITRFRRNLKTGALRHRGCVDNRDPVGGDDCARKAPGLQGVFAVALSPDGRFLYGGSLNAAALSVFRVAKRGVLRPRGCIEGPGALPPCATTAQGITPGTAFAFDSRGRSLYFGGNRLQPFQRVPRSGTLIERPCVQDNGARSDNTDCVRKNKTLGGITGLAVSPDDRFLYVTAAGDDAVGVFRRKR